jgi:hypothetical protein
MGAVGEGGSLVVNERVGRRGHISESEFAEAERRERVEVGAAEHGPRGTTTRTILHTRPGRARSSHDVGAADASTGAAAALWAAADDPEIAAVVSRGGRPDLAAPRLGEVRAPTLLVGRRAGHGGARA